MIWMLLLIFMLIFPPPTIFYERILLCGVYLRGTTTVKLIWLTPRTANYFSAVISFLDWDG